MSHEKDRHDFKNQLGIILGFSEILIAEARSNDRRRGDFLEIHTAARAALDLLARLYPERDGAARPEHTVCDPTDAPQLE